MANFKFIVPRVNDDKWKIFMEPSLKKIGAQALQVFDKDANTKENIFKKYNAGIEALFQTGLDDNDIIIFCHEDIGILDNFFREKIELIFSEKNDVGLVGVTGSIILTEQGGWWMNPPDNLRGHLIQGKNSNVVGEGFHLIKGPVGYFDDVIAVDGCILITQGKYLKEGIKFDDVNFPIYNDFYDIDFCFQFLERGYKIAVADILVYHQSTGMGSLQEPWQKAKEVLINKWKGKGYTVPFTRDQFKFKEKTDEIIEIEL